MDTLHKRIPLSKLRPGMYVEDVFNENELLLFSADILISGYHEIENLKKQGVSYLFVNTRKSKHITDVLDEDPDDLDSDSSGFPVMSKLIIEDTTENSEASLVNYQKELREAFNFRQKTVATIRNILNDIKAGRSFSIMTVVDTVDEMVNEVLENTDVFLRICQLKKHSYDTYAHSVNVSVLMAAFASALGYSKEKITEASIGGMLHDIGKVRIPENILRKSGPYSFQEMEIIRRHPAAGLEMIRKMAIKIPESSFAVIAQHHERFNGSGYPLKLKGKQIDEMAYICAIADVYDSLTSESNNRRTCLPQEALAMIFQGSDEEYPRLLVEHFTRMLGIYPVGSFVKLVSKEMGIVVKINRTSLLYPHVMILFDKNGNKIDKPFIINLSDVNDKSNTRIECSMNPEDYKVNADEYITS